MPRLTLKAFLDTRNARALLNEIAPEGPNEETDAFFRFVNESIRSAQIGDERDLSARAAEVEFYGVFFSGYPEDNPMSATSDKWKRREARANKTREEREEFARGPQPDDRLLEDGKPGWIAFRMSRGFVHHRLPAECSGEAVLAAGMAIHLFLSTPGLDRLMAHLRYLADVGADELKCGSAQPLAIKRL
ncbi:hypothetical protein LA345_13005 [Burkholderia vietnamiensis]|uniref:Uncharacterized protein n=1 Tax=Burkholderia vietnamiensis (strain G4 / LMG 22486) TaxID=269482 RepID=A4JFL7_BURVG|nr:hypothetical protein Bcep1808_2068 [Burkholderia vietnamiensis G4]MCB4344831.1 hypothetical protein [Burkholderia vietnamiensis]